MRKWPVIILSVWLLHIPFRAQKPSDSEQLGMALEYFQSAKYHEALLIFEKLDEHYTLNPRYHAYMGVCYYNEWLYQEACQYLDEAIPQSHLDRMKAFDKKLVARMAAVFGGIDDPLVLSGSDSFTHIGVS